MVIGYNLGVVNGEWWWLIIFVLLYVGFIYLLFNLMFIFLFVLVLECMLGKVCFFFVYVGFGIIGNIGIYVIELFDYVYVGVFGVIFGLFGVYLFMVLFCKELIG